jgi:hypothetical protein
MTKKTLWRMFVAAVVCAATSPVIAEEGGDRPALARLAGEPVPKSLSPELAVDRGRRARAASVREPVPLLVDLVVSHGSTLKPKYRTENS